VKSEESNVTFPRRFVWSYWSLRESWKRNRNERRAAESEEFRLGLHDRCPQYSTSQKSQNDDRNVRVVPSPSAAIGRCDFDKCYADRIPPLDFRRHRATRIPRCHYWRLHQTSRRWWGTSVRVTIAESPLVSTSSKTTRSAARSLLNEAIASTFSSDSYDARTRGSSTEVWAYSQTLAWTTMSGRRYAHFAPLPWYFLFDDISIILSCYLLNVV